MLAWIIYICNVVNNKLSHFPPTYEIETESLHKYIIDFTKAISGIWFLSTTDELHLDIIIPITIIDSDMAKSPISTDLLITLFNISTTFDFDAEDYFGHFKDCEMGIRLTKPNYEKFKVRDFTLAGLLHRIGLLLEL